MVDETRLREAYDALKVLNSEYLQFKQAHGHKGFPVMTSNINQIETLAFDLLQIAETEADVKKYPDNADHYKARLDQQVKSFMDYY